MIDNENFFDKKYLNNLELKRFFNINFLEEFNKKILILNLKKNKFLEFSSVQEFKKFNFDDIYDSCNEKYRNIENLFDEKNFIIFKNKKNYLKSFIKIIIDKNGKIYEDPYFLDNFYFHENKPFHFLDENFLKNFEFEKEFLLKTISKIKEINKTFLLKILNQYKLNYSLLDENTINETIHSILERKDSIIILLESFLKKI